MSSDSHKDRREKILRLLGDNTRKNNRRSYGPQARNYGGRLVHCGKEFHEFRPMGELCPNCRDAQELEEERAAARARKAKEDAEKARVFKPMVTISIPCAPKSDGQLLYEKVLRTFYPGKKPEWDSLGAQNKRNWENDAYEHITKHGRADFDSEVGR